MSTKTPRRENVHDQPHHTVSMDSGGVDELGIVPWPVLLRRRIAKRVGIDHRWAVMWVVLSGLFTVSCTITILVVSLQGIADDLGSNVSVLTWSITGPMLAFGVVGPAFGKAGDLWGHKRIFVTGLLLAGVFAIATAMAWSAASLIAFRTLSASAGSACGPSAMAYINRVFPPEDRVKPLGFWSFVTAGAPVLGVVIGAPLVEVFGWRTIFWAQAPLCFIGAIVALWLLPDTDRLTGVRFDVWGSLTLALGSVSLLAGISQGSRWGWASPAFVGCCLLSVASITGFVRIERTTHDPLVVMEWFRTRNVAWPVVTATLSNFAYMGGFILAPQLLQRGLGFSTTEVGWLVIARPLTFSVVAPLAGFVTVRVGERTAGVVGSSGVAASMVMWSMVGEGSSKLWIVVALGLSGAGLGIAVPALTSLMSNAVADADLGVAGAMQQLMNQLGAVMGSVVLTTISASAGPGNLGPFSTAFIVAAVVASFAVLSASQVRSTDRAMR